MQFSIHSTRPRRYNTWKSDQMSRFPMPQYLLVNFPENIAAVVLIPLDPSSSWYVQLVIRLFCAQQRAPTEEYVLSQILKSCLSQSSYCTLRCRILLASQLRLAFVASQTCRRCDLQYPPDDAVSAEVKMPPVCPQTQSTFSSEDVASGDVFIRYKNSYCCLQYHNNFC